MAVCCRLLFTDEEHAALQATVSTTQSLQKNVYDTGWQNVMRPEHNTANVHSEN